MKSKILITNFRKYSSFFIHIVNYKAFIDEKKSKQILLPNNNELNSLDEEILKYEKIIENNEPKTKPNKINILPIYKASLNNYFKPIKELSSDYSSKIKDIILDFKKKRYQNYFKKYKKNIKKTTKKTISIMTISRILRHKLKLHYLKTTPKNPIIKTNNYQFMLAIFIKVIIRSIKLGLKLIFIDETGFQLGNNNYYDWREYDELIFGGAKSDQKDRINLILAIDDEKILHQKLTKENIITKLMIVFLQNYWRKFQKKNLNTQI